jgi:hypothetical protein
LIDQWPLVSGDCLIGWRREHNVKLLARLTMRRCILVMCSWYLRWSNCRIAFLLAAVSILNKIGAIFIPPRFYHQHSTYNTMAAKASSTTPLIPASAEPTATTVSPFAVGVINAVSYLRAFAGFGMILAPTFTGKLFLVNIAPNSTASVALRLCGVRDAVIGELTWFARPKYNKATQSTAQTESEKHELRRILWANVATDSLDLAVLAFVASKGAISKPAAGIIAGGAIAGLILAGLGLETL